jgi:hypothetical protein
MRLVIVINPGHSLRALTVRVVGWNEKFSTMTCFGAEGVAMSLPAAGDGLAGICIFDMSVFEFAAALDAVVHCVSELPLESAPLGPHAARNKLSKLVTVTSTNFLFK